MLDGRQLGFDDSGGSSMPLVLLHGFGCDRSVWDRVAAQLPGTRLIRIDLRGCGESARGDGPALMETLAGDVAAVLDTLGVDNAVIAGHSLGGFVAFAFFRMYAERVAGLAFVASHARSDTTEIAASRNVLIRAIEADATMTAAVAAFGDRLVSPVVARDNAPLREELVAMIGRQDPLGSAQLLRGVAERVASFDLFDDITIPTLVLVGADDIVVTPEMSLEIAHGVAGATAIVLENVGHSVAVEAPEATASALAALLAKAVAAQP